MNAAIKLLAMHVGMAGLFFNKPKYWEIIEAGDDLETVISEHGPTFDVLLSASIEKIDKELLDSLPNLKMIASIAAGFSTIDLRETHKRGIAVTNSPGLNAGDVADIAASMMTSLLLKFPENQDFISSDKWMSQKAPIRRSIRGNAVGIVGLGSIGIEVVKRLEPFGLDIKWWGPRSKPDITLPYVQSLQELAKQCRGLVVCCRPDDSTYHLINANIIELLGPDGVIVNVSRGNVINEDALITALKNNKLAGAGLDVFDPEPTSAIRWRDVPNVILSPHQGGATIESLFAQASLSQKNIENFFAGEPLLTSVHS